MFLEPFLLLPFSDISAIGLTKGGVVSVVFTWGGAVPAPKIVGRACNVNLSRSGPRPFGHFVVLTIGHFSEKFEGFGVKIVATRGEKRGVEVSGSCVCA